ncbi:hypothetical protein SISNIDRAFT_489127 [Sistotremastrum niveocremeum HHB9708]|uniref:G-protein coupled receptors family 1 profile domain-containing protein n=1 Tax=Sistotremastrum niveocremeum HHB9708 TaxID=1314777 RepID=A0A164Q903_9AGAM|nr:hypothetical protein SISNIDRAFT_489127 [Sistotremastrum niveocremeum HHB9708]
MFPHLLRASLAQRASDEPVTAIQKALPDPTLQTLWVVLLLTGQIGLLALLLTIAFAKSIADRSLGLKIVLVINFTCTIADLLLFYGGAIGTGSPPFRLCLAQAILLHGQDAAFPCSVLLLVFETWRNTARTTLFPKFPEARKYIIVAIPLINYLGFAIATGVRVLGNPNRLFRTSNAYYCTVTGDTLGHAVTYVVVVCVFGMIILQGLIARFVWNHRRALRKLKTGPIKDMSIIIRLAFFVVWEMSFINQYWRSRFHIPRYTAIKCFLDVLHTNRYIPSMVLVAAAQAFSK